MYKHLVDCRNVTLLAQIACRRLKTFGAGLEQRGKHLSARARSRNVCLNRSRVLHTYFIQININEKNAFGFDILQDHDQ